MLGLALLTLGTQVAPPSMPVAAASVRQQDAAGFLPPLPAALIAPDGPAPAEALFEITLAFPAGGDLAELLVQAGAAREQARQAAELMRRELFGKLEEGSDLKLALGEIATEQGRSIERLTILHDLGRTVIARDGSALSVARGEPQIRHFEVAVGEQGAYSSLRSAGLDARLALEAAALLDKRAGNARRVTAVIGERPDRFERQAVPQLLYLAAARDGQRPLRLLRWPGTPDGWVDANRFEAEAGFGRPVDGRVSSRFRTRLHPILRILRPHQGVDFAAGWGTPVRAAADGQVVRAGWRGGYGHQVQLHHGDALTTSYSHLSDMAVSPGSKVKRGEVIGYVGASGLATGPHLHFEVARAGKRIDPLGARLFDATSAAERSAVAARLTQLRIGSGA